ncbi:putative nucleotide-utilizing enzyme [Methanophagales archaeon]|nr:putative nucleotide-utilizing enzyme [Methanophagales archaeon]
MNNRAIKKGKDATIINIGDELLRGDIADTNSFWLAKMLFSHGVTVTKIMVVGDDEDEISEALKSCNSDFVFVSGGLGPTHDDVTREGVAKGVGKSLTRNKEAERILTAKYGLTGILLKMADMPIGSEVIGNPIGTAPGFKVDNVIVMPGVPEELRGMFEPIASSFRDDNAIMVEEWVLTDKPEHEILDVLNEAVRTFTDVTIGSYPYLTGDGQTYKVRIKLVSRDTDTLKRAKKWLEESL